MTWSERIKLAWTTFKREALPLYAWTLIFIGVGVVLVVAMVMGVLNQMHWTFPQAYGGFSSPGMPVPGVPPTPGITPFTGPFGSPNQGPFGSFNGSLSDLSTLLSAVGTITGTLLLIIIVSWLIGSAFYTGVFNLTAKSYHEKVIFKDFRFAGYFRFLGWQGLLLLIQLILLIIGLIGAFTLKQSQGALVAFLIVYGLMIAGITIYALPWFSTSAIYLLAHPKDSFRDALSGSWRFFRKHMGALWGYIGTIVLIEIAVQVLNRISSGIAGLVTLIVSPFITVLAIVWILSLEEEEEDDHPEYVAPLATPPYYPTPTYPDTQPTTENPYISNTDPLTPALTPSSDQPISLEQPEPLRQPIAEGSTFEPERPKIDLQKPELRSTPDHPLPENKLNFCPSCGKTNTGTAYCPQCGTKL